VKDKNLEIEYVKIKDKLKNIKIKDKIKISQKNITKIIMKD